ncbi:MAG: AAA domain-containing protein [Polyangiaceae bacterium]|nr:AAA domain-containing protein [Polyangiaceae bacterium]
MQDPGTQAEAALYQLLGLWKKELTATRDAEHEQRVATPLVERIRRGTALQKLHLDEVEAKLGGRALLWLRPSDPKTLANFRLNGGEPVLLWQGHPDPKTGERGTLVRRTDDRIAVMVGANYADFIEEGAMNLDREAPEVTFERGKNAINAFLGSKDLRSGREVLFGGRAPRFENALPGVPFKDPNLNESQKQAVRFALQAQEIALIHGPPGTGKTQTLVEVVRQALQRDQSVLVTAPSNTAVDNLTERMLKAGLKPLRLGHPARISPAVEARTMDVLIEQTEESKLAQKWLAEARALRNRQHKRKARGSLTKSTGKDLLAEAQRLSQDARRSFDAARAKVLRRCRVVCTTCGGVDTSLLGEARFDMVIVDEATQAQDPIALAALERGKLWILAGDPQQLSPTVIDRDAAREGLGTTLFERLSAHWKETCTRMLTVQYRMHEGLIAYPSLSMYQNRLQTDASVLGRRLEDLPGIAPDPERPGPFLFLDTAGMGFSESDPLLNASTSNPAQAARTATEIQRLLARGVPATEIAAITPYSAQVKLLRELLATEVAQGLEIGTVDGFQGREKEVIVLDLVRSNDTGQIGFLSDVRRTNVAITRARSFLLVIGDSATLGGHEYYKSWIEFAQASGAWKSAWE